MSLGPADVTRLVALGAPVLCLDTCTLLDVVRDITRESAQLANVSAGLSLLQHAETRTTLAILVAEQVRIELANNLPVVEQEAQVALAKFSAQAQRIDQVATAFGAQGGVRTQHLQSHVQRARAVFDRWTAMGYEVVPDASVPARAFLRVNGPRTPARLGKESMKDCVVVETYIDYAGQLRRAGCTSPIVFASSNTRDYHAPGSSHVAPDIAADFGALQIEYAPNFGAAKHLLGL
jgi:hypothetical protein